MDEFDTWLADKLRELKTDEVTFGAYIKSILDEESEDLEEKIEGLEELLRELAVSKLVEG